MRYKPERALTLVDFVAEIIKSDDVEMRYKPERALTLGSSSRYLNPSSPTCRNEV